LPAAIGAQVGRPDKQVIAFVGDGSLQMTIQEMALMMNDRVPVKIVLLNNGSLGMVRQWQDLFYDDRFSETDISVSPDFIKIAEAYGVDAKRVADPKDLGKAVKKMLAHKGSYLLEVVVDKNEHVYPMVPAGGATNNMILHP
jgi:acetolactate synthase I/II/III large subunit